MRFADITPFTRSANYQISVDWKYLESTLENYDDKRIPGFIFDMDPDFQRGHVWSEEQQRRYVEFILRGGKSSRDNIFNCCGWQVDYRGPMVLVNGKQRLESARRFLRNELAVFDGHRYSDFEDSIRVVNASFTFHVNDLKTRPSSGCISGRTASKANLSLCNRPVDRSVGTHGQHPRRY